jgi:hypothetical protein
MPIYYFNYSEVLFIFFNSVIIASTESNSLSLVHSCFALHFIYSNAKHEMLCIS